MDEEEFQKRFDKAYGALIDDSFHSKIVGASYPNPDGSSRISILAASSPLDPFNLVPEPENPVDPKAIAVRCNDTGLQVGYLPERTAHDLLRQMDDPAGIWIAVLHKLNRNPETGEIVGANIIIGWISIEKITIVPRE